jgi:hypothetical protein
MVRDEPWSDDAANRDFHGPVSRTAAAQPRMTDGANGRADHGSLPSAPRSASARAYISHSLPTQDSLQFVPWATARAGVTRSRIQSLFITLLLMFIGPSVFRGKAQAQSNCRAITRQLSTIGPRARLADIGAAGGNDRDVIADAAVCAAKPESISTMSFDAGGRLVRIGLQPFEARAAFLGGVADPRDDGPAWTGRGANYLLRASVSLDYAWFHIVAAPQFWYAQNEAFEVFPSPDQTRSSFASPWYSPPFSIDLPSRFGAEPVSHIDQGESAAWLSVGPADIGVSASSQRWGPGERGTLLIGADAPGIPRVFARTSHPIRTRVGNFAATVFAGTLTESRFFDRDSTNDLRSMTAWNVAWIPSDSSAFTLGIAHAAQRAGARFGRSGTESKVHGPADQFNEVYGQFRDPRSGIRAWAEIGRAGALPIDRQFVTVPYQGLAYVVGAERALVQRRGTLLIALEATNLDQPTDVRGGVRQDFYTSANIPQGWSQRGQLLGSSIGPGGQSQWIATDWVATQWSFGLFTERVRWNEDALVRQYLPYPNRHDVTIRGGARGGIVLYGNELTVEGSIGHRINYLFQNATFIPEYRTVDISVPALRIAITPAIHLR